MQNLLEGLNKQQQEAVEKRFGTLLVLAGAGSGKTKVLTTRILNLIEQGAKPYEILAVTFTNKAAKEMKARLAKHLSEEVVNKMWVGTFHNICGRILRTDLQNYKSQDGKQWSNNYVIYDDADTNAIIKNAIKKCNLDEKVFAPKLVKTVISNAKNKMQDAYTFQSKAYDYRSQRIGDVYEEYEKTLLANNAIDFDDMLMLTVNLLEQNTDVRTKYFTRFKDILADEFQDTNLAQYKLLKLIYTNNLAENELKNRSLCVVGDVDQSIYSWRGADYRIILNFQNDFRNTVLIKLEQNYRSTSTILDAANAIIVNNTQRLSKNLFSKKGQGEKIEFTEAADDSAEAYYIASKIGSQIRNENVQAGDFAVLYRTNAQSRSIEEAMIAKNIPYKIVGGVKFYDRKEIKDIIAYLKLIYNTSDFQSLKRIINVPKRSIGASTIQKIEDLGEEYSLRPYEVLSNVDGFEELSGKTGAKLKQFYELIERFKTLQESYTLSEFIAAVIEESGYLQELKEENTEEAEGRIENLQELINVSKEYERTAETVDLGDFLAQVALVSDLDEMSDDNDAVTLMTLHAAKGLEFPIVFLAGLEEGVFPHNRSLNNTNEMEEERRLMYVGVTRAMKKLYLSAAKRRQVWGEYRYSENSRFLREIPQDLMESELIDTDAPRTTFKGAVDKIKSREYQQSNSQNNNSGYNGTTFGANFVAPKITSQKSITKISKPKIILNKKADPIKAQQKREEKINDIMNNNPIKKMIEQRKLEEQKIKEEQSSKALKTFEMGERVFHSKFGIGHIQNIENIGTSTIYTVDFGKMGIKNLDLTYSDLKSF